MPLRQPLASWVEGGLAILDANGRVAKINEALSDWLERPIHNLNEFTAETADLVHKILPRRMHFAVELTADALPVYLDAVELRQVVINLVLNAVDAMPQTGRLVLRTSAYEQLPSLNHYQGSLPRIPAACLSVQDSGCGIKARHRASVFEPFFTTKAMNKGSGLGLYNAKLFVEKHRGAISLDSQEGVGTTFHLWLPQADFTEADSAANVTISAGTRRSLLLVGRSGDTLDGTAEFLRANGYQVATSVSPAEILDTMCSRDCVFNGLVLLAEPSDTALLRIFPDVRRDHPEVRLILKVIGRDHHELPVDLLRQADVIIPSDFSQARILEKLAKQF